MRITAKTKMKELEKYSKIIELSKIDLLEECWKFGVPSKINGKKVRDFYDFSIAQLLLFWDVKDEVQLQKLTAKHYIGISENKIANINAIDFINLCKSAVDNAKYAADLFQGLKRKNPDSRMQKFIDSLPANDFSLIDRFCKRNGIVKRTTNEKSWFDRLTGLVTGEETPWMIVYNSFNEEVKEYDIQLKQTQLQKEDQDAQNRK